MRDRGDGRGDLIMIFVLFQIFFKFEDKIILPEKIQYEKKSDFNKNY